MAKKDQESQINCTDISAAVMLTDASKKYRLHDNRFACVTRKR